MLSCNEINWCFAQENNDTWILACISILQFSGSFISHYRLKNVEHAFTVLEIICHFVIVSSDANNMPDCIQYWLSRCTTMPFVYTYFSIVERVVNLNRKTWTAVLHSRSMGWIGVNNYCFLNVSFIQENLGEALL